MKGRSGRMGFYKVNAIRVKKAKQPQTIIRPYGYAVNNPRRNNRLPRGRPEPVTYSRDIVRVFHGLLFVGLLGIYLWFVYYIFPF